MVRYYTSRYYNIDAIQILNKQIENNITVNNP